MATRHRLTRRKRLTRTAAGRALLDIWGGLRGLFSFAAVIRVPRVLTGWRELPAPTRSGLGWIIACSVVLPAATAVSDLPGKWVGAGIMLAIFAVLFHLTLTGARMQQHALQSLTFVLERRPVGGPSLCTAVAHCGCLHTFAWDEVQEAWKPVSVVQSPECPQVVTV